LPETWQFMQKGQAFVGYPAIVDEGDAVGVRIFDTKQKAARQHQAGLMRLFQLALRKECTYIVKNLPKSAAAELAYNQLSKHPIIETGTVASYKDDMLYLVLYAVFIENKTIRTQQAFEQSLKQHKGELAGFANEAGK